MSDRNKSRQSVHGTNKSTNILNTDDEVSAEVSRNSQWWKNINYTNASRRNTFSEKQNILSSNDKTHSDNTLYKTNIADKIGKSMTIDFERATLNATDYSPDNYPNSIHDESLEIRSEIVENRKTLFQRKITRHSNFKKIFDKEQNRNSDASFRSEPINVVEPVQIEPEVIQKTQRKRTIFNRNTARENRFQNFDFKDSQESIEIARSQPIVVPVQENIEQEPRLTASQPQGLKALFLQKRRSIREGRREGFLNALDDTGSTKNDPEGSSKENHELLEKSQSDKSDISVQSFTTSLLSSTKIHSQPTNKAANKRASLYQLVLSPARQTRRESRIPETEKEVEVNPEPQDELQKSIESKRSSVVPPTEPSKSPTEEKDSLANKYPSFDDDEMLQMVPQKRGVFNRAKNQHITTVEPISPTQKEPQIPVPVVVIEKSPLLEARTPRRNRSTYLEVDVGVLLKDKTEATLQNTNSILLHTNQEDVITLHKSKKHGSQQSLNSINFERSVSKSRKMSLSRNQDGNESLSKSKKRLLELPEITSDEDEDENPPQKKSKKSIQNEPEEVVSVYESDSDQQNDVHEGMRSKKISNTQNSSKRKSLRKSQSRADLDEDSSENEEIGESMPKNSEEDRNDDQTRSKKISKSQNLSQEPKQDEVNVEDVTRSKRTSRSQNLSQGEHGVENVANSSTQRVTRATLVSDSKISTLLEENEKEQYLKLNTSQNIVRTRGSRGSFRKEPLLSKIQEKGLALDQIPETLSQEQSESSQENKKTPRAKSDSRISLLSQSENRQTRSLNVSQESSISKALKKLNQKNRQEDPQSKNQTSSQPSSQETPQSVKRSTKGRGQIDFKSLTLDPVENSQSEGLNRSQQSQQSPKSRKKSPQKVSSQEPPSSQENVEMVKPQTATNRKNLFATRRDVNREANFLNALNSDTDDTSSISLQNVSKAIEKDVESSPRRSVRKSAHSTRKSSSKSPSPKRSLRKSAHNNESPSRSPRKSRAYELESSSKKSNQGNESPVLNKRKSRRANRVSKSLGSPNPTQKGKSSVETLQEHETSVRSPRKSIQGNESPVLNRRKSKGAVATEDSSEPTQIGESSIRTQQENGTSLRTPRKSTQSVTPVEKSKTSDIKSSLRRSTKGLPSATPRKSLPYQSPERSPSKSQDSRMSSKSRKSAYLSKTSIKYLPDQSIPEIDDGLETSRRYSKGNEETHHDEENDEFSPTRRRTHQTFSKTIDIDSNQSVKYKKGRNTSVVARELSALIFQDGNQTESSRNSKPQRMTDELMTNIDEFIDDKGTKLQKRVTISQMENIEDVGTSRTGNLSSTSKKTLDRTRKSSRIDLESIYEDQNDRRDSSIEREEAKLLEDTHVSHHKTRSNISNRNLTRTRKSSMDLESMDDGPKSFGSSKKISRTLLENNQISNLHDSVPEIQQTPRNSSRKTAKDSRIIEERSKTANSSRRSGRTLAENQDPPEELDHSIPETQQTPRKSIRKSIKDHRLTEEGNKTANASRRSIRTTAENEVLAEESDHFIPETQQTPRKSMRKSVKDHRLTEEGNKTANASRRSTRPTAENEDLSEESDHSIPETQQTHRKSIRNSVKDRRLTEEGNKTANASRRSARTTAENEDLSEESDHSIPETQQTLRKSIRKSVKDPSFTEEGNKQANVSRRSTRTTAENEDIAEESDHSIPETQRSQRQSTKKSVKSSNTIQEDEAPHISRRESNRNNIGAKTDELVNESKQYIPETEDLPEYEESNNESIPETQQTPRVRSTKNKSISEDTNKTSSSRRITGTRSMIQETKELNEKSDHSIPETQQSSRKSTKDASHIERQNKTSNSSRRQTRTSKVPETEYTEVDSDYSAPETQQSPRRVTRKSAIEPSFIEERNKTNVSRRNTKSSSIRPENDLAEDIDDLETSKSRVLQMVEEDWDNDKSESKSIQETQQTPRKSVKKASNISKNSVNVENEEEDPKTHSSKRITRSTIKDISNLEKKSPRTDPEMVIGNDKNAFLSILEVMSTPKSPSKLSKGSAKSSRSDERPKLQTSNLTKKIDEFEKEATRSSLRKRKSSLKAKTPKSVRKANITAQNTFDSHKSIRSKKMPAKAQLKMSLFKRQSEKLEDAEPNSNLDISLKKKKLDQTKDKNLNQSQSSKTKREDDSFQNLESLEATEVGNDDIFVEKSRKSSGFEEEYLKFVSQEKGENLPNPENENVPLLDLRKRRSIAKNEESLKEAPVLDLRTRRSIRVAQWVNNQYISPRSKNDDSLRKTLFSQASSTKTTKETMTQTSLNTIDQENIDNEVFEDKSVSSVEEMENRNLSINNYTGNRGEIEKDLDLEEEDLETEPNVTKRTAVPIETEEDEFNELLQQKKNATQYTVNMSLETLKTKTPKSKVSQPTIAEMSLEVSNNINIVDFNENVSKVTSDMSLATKRHTDKTTDDTSLSYKRRTYKSLPSSSKRIKSPTATNEKSILSKTTATNEKSILSKSAKNQRTLNEMSTISKKSGRSVMFENNEVHELSNISQNKSKTLNTSKSISSRQKLTPAELKAELKIAEQRWEKYTSKEEPIDWEAIKKMPKGNKSCIPKVQTNIEKFFPVVQKKFFQMPKKKEPKPVPSYMCYSDGTPVPKNYTKVHKSEKWMTKKFYKHLEKVLEPKYGMSNRVEAEKIMILLGETARKVKKSKTYMKDVIEYLKYKLAKYGLIKTTWNFYIFVQDWLPYEASHKMMPEFAGKDEPKPEDVFKDIVPEYEKLHPNVT